MLLVGGRPVKKQTLTVPAEVRAWYSRIGRLGGRRLALAMTPAERTEKARLLGKASGRARRAQKNAKAKHVKAT